MTPGTAIMLYPEKALFFKFWVLQIFGIWIRGICLLKRYQIAGNVLSLFRGEPQNWHHGHLLDLELMTVIRAFSVIQIEHKGESLLGVIFRTDILLFVGTERPRTLSGIVHPTNQVIIISLLT